jgi:tetratricopeptide (TPR) repeat protein
MSLERAEAAAKEGLRVDPGNLELLSGLAATRFLAEDEPGFSAIEKRVLKINPSYSRFYTIVAEFAEWEHRYDDIVKLTRKAIAVDSRDAKAYATLGLNLIRKGEEPAGLEELRKAWRRDNYNVRVFNTLELYDGPIAHEYVTVDGARFRIRYHKGDKPILERYLPPLLNQAWASMVKRYGFSPQVPVGIEIYADRQHFSVRTSGLPNIGIQGVCFGKTLAALGPAVGRLNWGMIVWHELAHVFHIQLSKSRVPRWFTEGLAEYESLLARPEWRREEDPALYDAFRNGRVPKVAMFNRAFTHVEGPRDVTMAYFAASQIALHLAETRGQNVFAPMLRAWGAGKTTSEVMKDVLSVGPDAVDRSFLAWLKPRMAIYARQFVPAAEPAASLDQARDALATSPNDPERMLTLALTLARERKFTEARATLQIALASAPKHAGLNFAALQLAMGDKDEAKAKKYLAALLAAGHDGYAVRLQAANLAEVAGD